MRKQVTAGALAGSEWWARATVKGEEVVVVVVVVLQVGGVATCKWVVEVEVEEEGRERSTGVDRY